MKLTFLSGAFAMFAITAMYCTATGAEPGNSPEQVPKGLAKSDWQSIRAAYEAGRHAFQPVEGGWQARNPGQQWTTTFDGRGFLAQPRGADWQWGLELKSYGFPGAEREVKGVPAVKAEGQRLSYDWDTAVQEWWVNDRRGLEHGFIVQARPVGAADAPLQFDLAVRGTLTPHITADALGVDFRDAAGATVLNYTGLKVWDADGKVLASRFAPSDSQPSTPTSQPTVRLLVEERGARYPITIDPVAQQAYLKPADVGIQVAGDQFGTSVAVSGDTVVIGAPFEDSSTTGVDSIPNESATDAGAAYVFVRTAGVWTQQAYLKPAAVGTTQAGDFFGISVAISGDTVVVGAQGEDSSSLGVNSAPNETATNAGAAYVFTRSAGVWTQQAYLKPAAVGTTQAGDLFGSSVAISGDTVIVGAHFEDSNMTGVNSPPNDAGGTLFDSGAAYAFVRSAGVWTQQAYLKPAAVGTTQSGDNFGASVAVSGDTAVVGAFLEDSSTTGVNSTANESAADAGAVFVFTRSGTTWTQQAYLKPAAVGTGQGGDRFGVSVAIADDTLVVGANLEDSASTGVNSTPNESAVDSGAVYVFTRSAGTWTQQAYLKPVAVGTTQAGDVFGQSVAIFADTIVAGAIFEDSSTTGINSAPNEGALNAGAAYVFTRTAGVWTQEAYLKPATVGTTQAADFFGRSVAVSGDTVIVGAPREDSGTTGINSPPNENAAEAGAAGVFERSADLWSQQAYVKASTNSQGAGARDEFGFAVAVSGDTVVVGAYREDGSATGVNAPVDELAADAGAAYVFVRNGTTWSQQAYLKASQVSAGDAFGISVAIEGNTVVVGALAEDGSATGVNGTANELAGDAGAAYVFVRIGTTWSQQAYLKPAAVGTTQAGDEFGGAVAVSGDTVVVGAYREDGNAKGVNGPADEDATNAGAAYVFVRSGTTWSQQAYLKPAAVGTTQAGDEFGRAVAIAGDTVVVGAFFEDGSATGVNGPADELATNAGAAYVFVRNGTIWSQQAYLKASQVSAGDSFGISVAVSGDTVVVGASGEDGSATGVNGPADELATNAGAAYVFVRNGTIWSQQAYLKASQVSAGDAFGRAVAIAGNTLVVGALFEDGSATGVNGTANELKTDAGAGYVFVRSGTTWSQLAYLKASQVSARDEFGRAVAIAGDTVVVGARFEDGSATGVNGPADELASDSGAAYVFLVPRIVVEQPVGFGLFAGSSVIAYGEFPSGGTGAARTFTVRNRSFDPLLLSSVSVTGGNAGDFSVDTTGTLSSVPGGGSTTFAVTFTPPVTSITGNRTTTLRIVNDDSLDGTFDIALTALVLSFTADADGDGLNDASELQLAALGFDWQAGQPALVNTLFSNTAGLQPNLNAAGFFTPAQVQALHLDAPLIQRDAGTGVFTLTLGLGKSTNLAVPNSFVPFPFTGPGTIINGQGKIEFQFTLPDNAAFFRLEGQ
jgi:FG-GAP repeat